MKPPLFAMVPEQIDLFGQTGAGLALIDLLMENLDRRQSRAVIDAALDLRSLVAVSARQGTLLAAFGRLRDLLDGRFCPLVLRLQCWLATEGDPEGGAASAGWTRHEAIPLDQRQQITA